MIFLQHSSAGHDPMTCLVDNETSFELAGLERQAAVRIPRMLRSTTTSYLMARQVWWNRRTVNLPLSTFRVSQRAKEEEEKSDDQLG